MPARRSSRIARTAIEKDLMSRDPTRTGAVRQPIIHAASLSAPEGTTRRRTPPKTLPSRGQLSAVRTDLLFTMTDRTRPPSLPSGSPWGRNGFSRTHARHCRGAGPVEPAALSQPEGRESAEPGDRLDPPLRRVAQEWWSQTGSNRRPHACKARALPTELWPLVGHDGGPGKI